MSIADEQWKAEGIALGMEKGMEKGLEKGLREGQVRALLRQLEHRFGPVSESARGLVAAADITALELWLDRVLDAPTLDAVFTEDQTH